MRAGWVPEYAWDEALRIWIRLPSEKEQKELSVDQMPRPDGEKEITPHGETSSIYDEDQQYCFGKFKESQHDHGSTAEAHRIASRGSD